MNETEPMAEKACAEHGDALVWEPGGDDMPALRGRWYCPTCQRLLVAVLDQMPGRESTPPGRSES